MTGSDSDDEDNGFKPTVEKQPVEAPLTKSAPTNKPPGASRPPVKKSVLARYAHVTEGSEESSKPSNDSANTTAKPNGGGPGDYSVDEEVSKLCDIAERLIGGPRGIFKFKDIFYDHEAESAFESLVGTLLAARKRKILVFEGPMLLQGVHDDLDIVFTGRP